MKPSSNPSNSANALRTVAAMAAAAALAVLPGCPHQQQETTTSGSTAPERHLVTGPRCGEGGEAYIPVQFDTCGELKDACEQVGGKIWSLRSNPPKLACSKEL